MEANRILNCLRTLRKRTEPQHYVLGAWSRRDYSPSVRSSIIHSINFLLTCAIALADPIIGGMSCVLCFVLMIVDRERDPKRDRSGLDMALIKIDGASHAQKHAQCRFGQSFKRETPY